jgi:hypothetical protein
MSFRSYAQQLRVALVQMPFALTSGPSLALSLLKAILIEKGYDARVLYFNQEFSKIVGADLYSKIARGAPQNVDLAGEWVFSSALWGDLVSKAIGLTFMTSYVGDTLHTRSRLPMK